MSQLSLFEQPTRSKSPPANRTSTSIAAAQVIADMSPTLRGKVFAAIGSQGATGATRNELVAITGIKLQTICGRCNELLHLGLIYQTSEARHGGKVLRRK